MSDPEIDITECPVCGQRGRYEGRIAIDGRGYYECPEKHRLAGHAREAEQQGLPASGDHGMTFQCGRCQQEKPRDAFYARGGGVQPWCKACQLDYRQANRERVRGWNYKHKGYGLTLEQRDAMERAQGGLCAICNEPPHPKRPLHTDHDHETGRVRRLLCNQCNRILGLAKDNPKVLDAAAEYLREHGR